jgi:hypothetical protein
VRMHKHSWTRFCRRPAFFHKDRLKTAVSGEN